jgi:hypothetical protein
MFNNFYIPLYRCTINLIIQSETSIISYIKIWVQNTTIDHFLQQRSASIKNISEASLSNKAEMINKKKKNNF